MWDRRRRGSPLAGEAIGGNLERCLPQTKKGVRIRTPLFIRKWVAWRRTRQPLAEDSDTLARSILMVTRRLAVRRSLRRPVPATPRRREVRCRGAIALQQTVRSRGPSSPAANVALVAERDRSPVALRERQPRLLRGIVSFRERRARLSNGFLALATVQGLKQTSCACDWVMHDEHDGRVRDANRADGSGAASLRPRVHQWGAALVRWTAARP